MGHLFPEMTNDPHHNALDLEGIGLLHDSSLAIVGLDRGLAIDQRKEAVKLSLRWTRGRPSLNVQDRQHIIGHAVLPPTDSVIGVNF